MDYEYYYNNARNRYYNACTEISNCENRIINLNGQKQKKINEINQLKADLKNNQEAYEDVNKTLSSSETLNTKLLDVDNKTAQASLNFTAMAESDSIAIKNISDACSDETTKTKQTLQKILEDLNTKKTQLSNKIEELQRQLSNAQSDLEDIKSDIASNRSSIQDWKHVKNGASYDMEYYRRKMLEAV